MNESESASKATPEQQRLIKEAVNAGIENYIQSRKEKVPAFVEKHFSFKGATKLHQKAIGKDLYKAPLNILWSVPLLGAKSLSFLLQKAGADTVSARLELMPRGFETAVQKEINWLIYTELLEIPYRQDHREADRDALLEAILQDERLSELIGDYLQEINRKSVDEDFRITLKRNLGEYASSRTAAADLSGSVISLASNYAAFQKLAPGAVSSGKLAAAVLAEKIAISNFWLGSTIGGWYYTLFPATASSGLLLATTSGIIAGLAIITTFTGIVTDPLQAKLGLHQKRLNHFLDVLHDELQEKEGGQYRVKDLYVARVFDIVDLLITAVR